MKVVVKKKVFECAIRRLSRVAGADKTVNSSDMKKKVEIVAIFRKTLFYLN